MASYELDIVTPSGSIFSGPVERLQAPGSEGSFGVLAGHAPMIAALEVGSLRFGEGGGGEDDRTLACSGGFVEVRGDRVTVLAESAEFGDQIDLARAEAARDRASERLRQSESADLARAEAGLSRALNRIRIASGG